MLNFPHSTGILWVAITLLLLGSIYLIVEGYHVHKLFAESTVGRLIKTLVIVFLVELYSLGVASAAFVIFYPKGVGVIMPIVFLWFICLVYAIYAIRSAKREVTGLVK